MALLYRSMVELRAQLKALGAGGGTSLNKSDLLKRVRKEWGARYEAVVDECMAWRGVEKSLARTILLDLVALAYMDGRSSVVATPDDGRPVMAEHRCLQCRRVDEGPNAECKCMEPGEPCAICGTPDYEPLTPWKGNDHWAEDGHEWEPVKP